MSLIFLNGKWLPPERACISVYDHGFLYGDGLFETMRAYDGRIFRLAEHMERLWRGAEVIRLDIPYTRAELGRILNDALEKNNLWNARLRLTVSRGEGPLGLDVSLCRKPNIVIMADDFNGYSPDLYTQGVSAVITSIRRQPQVPAIKSLSFLPNIQAKMEAAASGAFEGLMLSVSGHLCEGTVSNLFFISGGKLMTPAPDCGPLPGITRQAVLDLARKTGKLEIEEGWYTPEHLRNADEAFLTNTGMEILPLVKVDHKNIGNGQPGVWTKRLHEIFNKWIMENG